MVVTEQVESVCYIGVTLEDTKQTSEQQIYSIENGKRKLVSDVPNTYNGQVYNDLNNEVLLLPFL